MNVTLSLAAVGLVVAAVLFMIARSVKRRSRAASILRVLINYLQLNATLGDFDLHGPAVLASWFGFSEVRLPPRQGSKGRGSLHAQLTLDCVCVVA